MRLVSVRIPETWRPREIRFAIGEIYENLAAQDEAMADRIMSALSGLPCEFQNRQVERANLLRRDAQSFRELGLRLGSRSCSKQTFASLVATHQLGTVVLSDLELASENAEVLGNDCAA